MYSDTSTGAGQREALEDGLAPHNDSGGIPSPRAAFLPLVESGMGLWSGVLTTPAPKTAAFLGVRSQAEDCSPEASLEITNH